MIVLRLAATALQSTQCEVPAEDNISVGTDLGMPTGVERCIVPRQTKDWSAVEPGSGIVLTPGSKGVARGYPLVVRCCEVILLGKRRW
ncbi:hypothetical protein NDU88_003402 [Pleurodeles waltl]|uniref:Uncharacterized protein n=1 Tax=Pleurodeles waltl TaxID=8319 RepID=A0AAV7KWF2_PLEWA|nr:hypothetical protein NDU88_003402 [Pleurodeles waltl]